MNKKIIYVLQGGGALGSFQLGGVKALYEKKYFPNMLVGISIGAINAAIIAGNEDSKVIEKLEDFWNMITTKHSIDNFFNGNFLKFKNYLSAQQAIFLGQDNFYKKNNIIHLPFANYKVEELSYYDISPLKDTLNKLIDFNYLNEKHKRLCVGVTNLSSGEFVFFDSFKEEIKLEHILASGALPPAFPAVKIGDQYYVDGGVYANTPLTKVLEEFETNEENVKNNLVFMFDLFSAKGILPHSMDGMLERIKDIQFSSHSKRPTNIYSTVQNMSRVIKLLGSYLPSDIKNREDIKQLLKLGNVNNIDLVHIIYHSKKGTELESKDYNFSREAKIIHKKEGYKKTLEIIKEDEESWLKKDNNGIEIHTLDSEN